MYNDSNNNNTSIKANELEKQEKLQKLKKYIAESKNIVFFGGAGVSTESGIPDFRSTSGLYNQKYKYPPEEILSHSFFYNNTEEFFEFYRNKMNSLNYKPNITHIKLAELEKSGKLKAIITQNIDGLHQKAGSNIVYELHGSSHRNYCINCGKAFDAKFVFENSNSIPICTCGGIVKPDVVLYEENLNQKMLADSINAISTADMLIIGGTSLTVFPASNLVYHFHGRHLVLINKNATIFDKSVDLLLQDSLGNIFKEL
ncbi:MAG: NAD-dependent protein deacylase [Clostridia bacterium]